MASLNEQPIEHKHAHRLRVLLSAYACEPGKGSEPEAGWQWALQMARWYDVTVATRSNNASNISAALAKVEGSKPNFIFLDLPPWMRWLKRRGLPISIYYVLWQALLRWRVRKQLHEFDLIHHVTFNTYRWPGFWAGVGKPVILGPLGGGQICPWRLLPLFGLSGPAELLRSTLVLLSRFSPFHLLNCLAADHLIIANRDTLTRIPSSQRRKTTLMLDAGIHAVAPQSHEPGDAACRVMWAGMLTPRKAAALAIRAFAEARAHCDRLQLTIVGEGPERRKLKNLARDLGVGHHVVWTGRLPRTDAINLMRKHDFFLFTSLRDTSGYVVLEAMASGLPVLTLNHQGAAEMTTPDCAVQVTPSSIGETIRRLAAGMVTLANDPEMRQRLGAAGAKRVADLYLWESKAQSMDEIYRFLGGNETMQNKKVV